MRSFDVENFSPPPSPEVEEGELAVDTGPEPYQWAAGTNSDADDASEAAAQERMGLVSEW